MEAEAWHLLVPHQLLLSQVGVEASNLEYVNYIAHSTPYNTHSYCGNFCLQGEVV